MVSIKRNIQTFCDVCLHCGSLYTLGGSFCEDCWKVMDKWQSCNEVYIQSLRVLTLFDWVPEKTDALSQLILSLKEGSNSHRLKKLAQTFVKRFGLREVASVQPIILIPSPAKSTMENDHAFLWAEALQSEIGGLIWNGLQRDLKKSQKESNRHERSKINLSYNEKYTKQLPKSPQALYVFVDDVITTGSTSLAAYHRMGCPINFTVWALARRVLTCGVKAHLL